MNFLDLARKRYSARRYTDKPVEREKLDLVLEAGRVAPTACNNQPQRIIVVQSKEGLNKLTYAYKSFGAPLALVVCADTRESWNRGCDGMDSAQIDAAIVTDHMMLCAADLGLDSVWVCAFDPVPLREQFALPDYLVPVNILFIGYADGEAASPGRHDTCRKPHGRRLLFICDGNARIHKQSARCPMACRNRRLKIYTKNRCAALCRQQSTFVYLRMYNRGIVNE